MKKLLLFSAISLTVLLSIACSNTPTQRTPLSCNDSLKSQFAPDSDTQILLVKQFQKGERLALADDNPMHAPVASNEVCLVKLLVGPGTPGDIHAPSTSKGIGIEIWLPSPKRWNRRIHAVGGGGWQGGAAALQTYVGSSSAALIATNEGAVSSTTDTGHTSVPFRYSLPLANGDFMMLPDGSINKSAWHNFSHRAIHEQAVKTKQLAQAYYGKKHTYAYWEGSSLGGRQGYQIAQLYPEDFDGIIANMPALYWTKLLPSMAYPHIVMQNDLDGTVLSKKQLDLASNAAISACDIVGGVHLGYILNPAKCHYDITQDSQVLCAESNADNTTAPCLTSGQALAIQKFWYGQTIDGSGLPTGDNHYFSYKLNDKQLWFGVTQGTSLWNAFFSQLFGIPSGVAHPAGPFFLATDQMALQLQDPRIADETFLNATSNGLNHWQQLSYADAAKALQNGQSLALAFADVDTDNPDLSLFKARGGKLLTWHGLNDEVIPPQGTVYYYNKVLETMGGVEDVQSFYQLFLIPGAGHESPNGTSNQRAKPPILKPGQMYNALVSWVEKGIRPEKLELTSATISQPACPYPEQIVYTTGDPRKAASYTCQ